MAYNIDFAAAIKASKPDNYSKAVGFPGNSKDMSYSFRDSLKEAVRSNSSDELKADDRNALRREMVVRSGSKLKSIKNTEAKPVDKDEDKPKDKVDVISEQIISKLEELANLQQQGKIPAEKHTALLESVKAALKELETVQLKSAGPEASGLQAKAAEITALLEAQLPELKTSYSLTAANNTEGIAEVLKTDNSRLAGNTAGDIVSELRAILSNEPQKAETKMNTAAEINPAKVSLRPDAAMSETKETANTGVKEKTTALTTAQKPEEKEGLQAQVKQTDEAPISKNQEIKAGTPVVENRTLNKEVKPAAEENVEDVKSALDSKVEKITVENKENQKQGAEPENGRETAKDVHKLANTVHNKFENADMSAIKSDQKIIDNRAEAVQSQTASARPESVNKAEVINQIVKKAEIVFTDSQPEIRMQLEPENLGKLTLKLAVEKGLITAKFITESYEVKQIIESSFNELKDMLQEKGLEVQNFSVSVGQEDKGYNSNSFQQWKETVRLNGRSTNRGSYAGYLEGEGTPVRTINPYSVHNGKFDHRA